MNREKDIPREEKELLTRIRAKPVCYLGDYAGLRELKKFIDGYAAAALLHHLHISLIPEDFQTYVEDYFFMSRYQPYSWCDIIQQHQPDDRAALGYFWELLNEYLESVDCEPIPAPAEPPESTPKPDGIHRIEWSDLARLAESYMRTFNGEPWWDRWDKKSALRRLQDFYHTPHFSGFAVWKQGTPLGAVLGRGECYYDEECFQIIELWVEPRVQKQGWGRKLLDELMTDLRSAGTNRFFLITMHGDQTEGFYRRCRFQTQEEMCVMQLDLHQLSERDEDRLFEL